MKPELAIIGVGLMGGSLAAALRAAGFVGGITGIDTDPAALALAGRAGLIDRAAGLAAVGDADIVVLATPVASLPRLLADIMPLLSSQAVVTDMGSVKAPVAGAATALRMSGFIPSHPIAGAEHSGPGAADATLFRDRVVIVTPTTDHDPRALDLIEAMWTAVGAHVVRSEPVRHDQWVAYTSHLPHLLAFAAAELLAQHADGEELLPFIGTGLKDFLRIAGSDPVMWRDICVTNSQSLGAALSAYSALLADYARAVAAEDGEGLRQHFARAREYARQRGLGPDHGD
ncbi:MAG: prephenate dehydrogenase [Acidiferrobacter sp.]